MIETLSLPFSYDLAVLITLFAAGYGMLNLRKSWAPAFLAVIGTFAAWYLIEPHYAPSTMMIFSAHQLSVAYMSAAFFISGFIVFHSWMRKSFLPRRWQSGLSIRENMLAPGAITSDRLATLAIMLWLVLLAYGVWRLQGDVMQALFPLSARSGVQMWQRGATAGASTTGLIVSIASYLYILALATFGLLLPIVRKPQTRALLLLVILVAWPYAFLQGSRNITLAVMVPLFVSMFMFARISPILKAAVLLVGFVLTEFAFRAIIVMRSTGFNLAGLESLQGQRHLGLSMGTELVWITTFVEQGSLSPTWGLRYLEELVVVIPRVLWPDKPLIGIDYAILRGFGGASNDIGVVATISSGMVGQGVINFGLFLGPLFAGFLMACWANFLTRLRLQGTAPRVALFLIGLGLTFNLGRDITLLVLFPFVFGYVVVRVLERPRGKSPGLARRSAPPAGAGIRMRRGPAE